MEPGDRRGHVLPKSLSPATDKLIAKLRSRGLVVRDQRQRLKLRTGKTWPPYPNRYYPAKWLVIHHTGSGATRPSLTAVVNYQIGPSPEGAPGVQYTFFVPSDGSLDVCYDLEAAPWSQGIGSPATDPNGEGVNNDYGMSICFSGQDPTDAQWATILTVLECLPSLALTGHRQVDPGTTECPGEVASSRIPPLSH